MRPAVAIKSAHCDNDEWWQHAKKLTWSFVTMWADDEVFHIMSWFEIRFAVEWRLF